MAKQAAAVAKPNAFPARSLGFGSSVRGGSGTSRIGFEAPASVAWRKRSIQVARQGAIRSEVVVEEKASPPRKDKVYAANRLVLIFLAGNCDSVSTQP